MARTLLVIGDRIDAADGQSRPQRDYDALRDELDADVIHAGDLAASAGRARGGMAMARLAAERAVGYDHVYCDSEHIGFPLAWMLAKRAPRPRLTMIAHYLSPAKKQLTVKLLRLTRKIDALALHSPAQVARARALGFKASQIAPVPYQVDTRFFQPRDSAHTHILSVGREFRDYPTLVAAARGLDAHVRIAAGSHWSTRTQGINAASLPHNVRSGMLQYAELRDAYAAARFVVVPLHDVDFQAGIITILESMAMGKAVIVSRTRGQTGAVSGRLLHAGVFTDIGEDSWDEPTGMYVRSGDPVALRGAIDYLLAHPETAARMGVAGRRRAEQEFSLDHFVRRMARVIAPEPALVESAAS